MKSLSYIIASQHPNKLKELPQSEQFLLNEVLKQLTEKKARKTIKKSQKMKRRLSAIKRYNIMARQVKAGLRPPLRKQRKIPKTGLRRPIRSLPSLSPRRLSPRSPVFNLSL